MGGKGGSKGVGRLSGGMGAFFRTVFGPIATDRSRMLSLIVKIFPGSLADIRVLSYNLIPHVFPLVQSTDCLLSGVNLMSRGLQGRLP